MQVIRLKWIDPVSSNRCGNLTRHLFYRSTCKTNMATANKVHSVRPSSLVRAASNPKRFLWQSPTFEDNYLRLGNIIFRQIVKPYPCTYMWLNESNGPTGPRMWLCYSLFTCFVHVKCELYAPSYNRTAISWGLCKPFRYSDTIPWSWYRVKHYNT